MAMFYCAAAIVKNENHECSLCVHENLNPRMTAMTQNDGAMMNHGIESTIAYAVNK